MSLPWLLAAPASRGIGWGFAGHLLATTAAPVVATARSDLSGARKSILSSLEKHGMNDKEAQQKASDRLEVVELDVTREDSIQAAAEHCKKKFPLKEHHLHLAFLSPGILVPEKAPEQIEYDNALEMMKINLLGPMLLAKHFVPFLPRRSTKMAEVDPSNASSDAAWEGLPKTATMSLMSARVGSITDNRFGGWYSYRCTKAGVTQLAKTLDLHLIGRAGDKAMAVALHPGTVKTGLSKGFWDSEGDKANEGRGLFEPDVAARQLVDVVRELQPEKGKGRGGFWDWKGEVVAP